MVSVVLWDFVILFYFISQRLQLSFDSDRLLCYFPMNSIRICIKGFVGPDFLYMLKCSLVLLLFIYFFPKVFKYLTPGTVNCLLRYFFDRNASSNQIKQPNSEIILVHVPHFNPAQCCSPHELHMPCAHLLRMRTISLRPAGKQHQTPTLLRFKMLHHRYCCWLQLLQWQGQQENIEGAVVMCNFLWHPTLSCCSFQS